MERKAYDPKRLLEILKAKGLDVAEDMVAILVQGNFEWLKESAVISTNKVDDFLALGYPHAEKLALEQVDLIDGKDDPGR